MVSKQKNESLGVLLHSTVFSPGASSANRLRAVAASLATMSEEKTKCSLCKMEVNKKDMVAHLKQCSFFDMANEEDEDDEVPSAPKRAPASSAGVSYVGASSAADDDDDGDDDYSRPVRYTKPSGGYGGGSSSGGYSGGMQSSGPPAPSRFPVRHNRKQFLADCKAQWRRNNRGQIEIRECNKGWQEALEEAREEGVDPPCLPHFCPYCKYAFEDEDILAHIRECAERHKVDPCPGHCP